MDYSYAQMKEMQEQAFERVREMQKKADTTARQAMHDIGGFDPNRSESADVNRPKKIPDEPKRYSMPVEFPERESHREQPKSTADTATGATQVPHFGNGDEENALLMTLMLLLNTDGADKELLFALLYIFNG